ncbi:MAG: hypothetical protein IPN76_27155 [Saprospiraceae bacterium]|nr:hypothetical protein [Saprospiraceae bacterium]
MKKLNIDKELRQILTEIKKENKSLEDWREIESCDMFQSNHFCGGFDSTEDAFTFSYFDGPNEFWFQVTLEEVEQILNGQKFEIEIRNAE